MGKDMGIYTNLPIWRHYRTFSARRVTFRMGSCSILAMDRNRCNSPRHDSESRDSSPGHYESWFLRGNHPSRPLAFWIRYTIFHPRGGDPVEQSS